MKTTMVDGSDRITFKRFAAWFLVFSTSFHAMHLTDWLILRFSNLHLLPMFNDTRLILNSSDCARNLAGSAVKINVAQECTYNYGYTIIDFFHFFDINADNSNSVGLVLAISYILLLSFFASLIPVRSSRGKLFLFFILFSHPSIFLVERGNLDIVMIELVTLFVVLLIGTRFPIFIFPLFLSALIKFYTLPIFIFLFFTRLIKPIKAILLFFLLLGLVLVVPNILEIDGNFPRNCSAAFGNAVIFECAREVGIHIPSRLQDFLGIMLLVPTYMLVIKLRLLPTRKIEHTLAENLSFYLSLVFLACYFAFVNVDYRLIFLLFPALYEVSILRNEPSTRFKLGALLLCAVWLGDISFGLQPLGDFCIMFWVVILTMRVLDFSRTLIGELPRNYLNIWERKKKFPTIG